MRLGSRLWLYFGLSLGVAGIGAGASFLTGSASTGFVIVFLLLLAVALAFEVRGFPPEMEERPGTGLRSSPVEIKEKFARKLLDRLPFAMILIHDSGRVTHCNGAAETLAPWVEKNGHYTNSFRAPAVLDAIKGTFADGKARAAEFQVAADERYFQARIAVLPKAFGRDGHRRVVMQIHDRTAEYATNVMRTDFVANASHELRTPLASVLGYVETLRSGARDDPDVRDEFLGIIHEQSLRMQRLVDDLMSLSRIELDEHLPPEERCDVREAVGQATDALRPIAETNESSLVNRLPEDARLETLGDADQLSQVFTNLIDNAIRHGGGDIEIKVAESDPRFPDMFGIAVSDSGPGIAREHVPRLTERFYRVDAARSREKGGTGLGLAIAKHVLNRHHGTLEINSAPGEGSRFTVWLRSLENGTGVGSPTA